MPSSAHSALGTAAVFAGERYVSRQLPEYGLLLLSHLLRFHVFIPEFLSASLLVRSGG